MINRLIFVLSLLGIILTIHLWIQKQRGFDQGCLGFSKPSLVSTSECKEVVESDKGSVFGVDNVVLGFLFYVGLGALSFSKVITESKKSRNLELAMLSLTGVGFLFTLYLIYLQFFVLESICILCLISAVIVTTVFGLQGFRFLKDRSPATGAQSSEMAKEIGLFALVAFLAATLLAADIFFVNKVGASSPTQAQNVREIVNTVLESRIDESFLDAMAPCTFDNATPPVENMGALISQYDPYMGTPEAPLTVLEIFDPNCPHCKQMHAILKKVIQNYHTRARFYFKPFPLWDYSIQQIEAIWIAAEQRKYFEMIELQFQAQHPGRGLSLNELKVLADSLNLDVKAFERDLRSGRYREQVLQYKRVVNSVGIHSAPKVLINGRFVGTKTQTITESCLSRLIEQELATNGSK